MPVDFETILFLACQDTLAFNITVTPLVSQPGQPAYGRRAILNTREIMVQTDVGMAVLSDQETIADLLEGEYPIELLQGDRINIAAQAALPAKWIGEYEVVSTSTNGAGQTTLVIRKFETPAP
jgi:hypothetical protein